MAVRITINEDELEPVKQIVTTIQRDLTRLKRNLTDVKEKRTQLGLWGNTPRTVGKTTSNLRIELHEIDIAGIENIRSGLYWSLAMFEGDILNWLDRLRDMAQTLELAIRRIEDKKEIDKDEQKAGVDEDHTAA